MAIEQRSDLRRGDWLILSAAAAKQIEGVIVARLEEVLDQEAPAGAAYLVLNVLTGVGTVGERLTLLADLDGVTLVGGTDWRRASMISRNRPRRFAGPNWKTGGRA